MRPSSGEVATALYGAWRLMRFDSKAMSYFDKSVDGFWKSFYAAVFWIPLSAGLSYFVFSSFPNSHFNPLTKAVADTAYLFAFPFAIYGLCLVTGLQKNFISCVVAFNWTRIIQMVVTIPLVLIFFASGDATLDTQSTAQEALPIGVVLLALATILYIIAFEVFIFSRGLSISIAGGVGMIFFELFFALIWLVVIQIITSVNISITG